MSSFSETITDDEPWKNKELMFGLYDGKDYTYQEIADYFGCAQSTVSSWMVRHRANGLRGELDVDIPDEEPYKDAELMEELYINEELSTTKVAAVLDCSTGAVMGLFWMWKDD